MIAVNMKTISIAVIASVLGLLAAATPDTGYCVSKLCRSGEKHIGCGNYGSFSPDCPAGQTNMVPITNDLKAKIVDSHNSKRNTIAAGKLRDYKPATRMATMSWDDELALLASYNVKTCKFAHDQCRNTNTFRYSGQNLGKYWSSGAIFTNRDTRVILESIDSWWKEYHDATPKDLEKYKSTTNSSKKIGHFTVMTAEKNVAVGCAAIRFPDRGYPYSLTLACNYATTNIIDRAMYTPGLTASKCTAGRNPQYTALCSISEKYD